MVFVLLNWLQKEHGVKAEITLKIDDEDGQEWFLIPDKESQELHQIAREAAQGSVTE